MSQRCVVSLFLAASLILPVSSMAQEQEDPNEADHEQLRGVLATLREAVNNRDLDAMESVMYSPFSVTMIDQELIRSRAELDAYYNRMMVAEDALIAELTIEPAADTLTHIIDGRFGLSRGGNTEVYELTNGRSFTLESRWTAAVVKDEGAWKVLGLHAGVDFTDNPILDVAGRASLYFGGGGLVAGLLVGLFAGMYVGRSRG